MKDASTQTLCTQSTVRSRRRVITIAVAVIIVACLLLWILYSSHPINLTTANPPTEKGWQIEKEPFWVKGEAIGALPKNSQWNGQYVIVVFKNGAPYYQRMIDAAQIQAGKPFDLALAKTGTQYSAAFVEIQSGKPGRRLSNILSFTH